MKNHRRKHAHSEEFKVEGIHVAVRPEWLERVEREIQHVQAHHPGVLSRVTIRFKPIKPHHHGMAVSMDGRIDAEAFNVEREGDDVPGVIHETFALALRHLQSHTKRDRRPSDLRTETTDEEDITEEELTTP